MWDYIRYLELISLKTFKNYKYFKIKTSNEVLFTNKLTDFLKSIKYKSIHDLFFNEDTGKVRIISSANDIFFACTKNENFFMGLK